MKKKLPLLSLIIPVHNEEANLLWHHGVIVSYMAKIKQEFEIIYVDDGSTDTSLDIIKKLSTKPNVSFLSFSRNFGKEAATTAGIAKSRGDAAIMIDADGQHPIELVETFIDEWKNGFQVIVGVRKSNTGEGLIKAVGSKLFYWMLRIISGTESSTSGMTDFRLIDRCVIDEYNKLTEHNRITRNLIDWLGFRRKLITFNANERHAGKASYSFRKLLKLAVDGIIKHSTRPLKFIGIIGALISIVSLLLAIALLIEQFSLGDPLRLAVTASGYLALFLSFMVGVVLFCQGLLALYLENVYYETQNRPLFIINEDV